MIEKYIIGILGITGLMLGWVAVQQLWRRVFNDQLNDSDVLVNRSDCGSCGCSTPCNLKRAENND